MRSIEDKGCLNLTPTHEISSNGAANFEFHTANGKNRTSHHRTALGKPTPSKWDDAQKWLVNLSRGGEKSQSKTEPRNSNADDRRLIAPVPKKEDYSSSDDESKVCPGSSSTARYEVETKNVDYDESHWRANKPDNAAPIVRSICVRDMGTDMTPIASQEPSRAATPIRAMTPAGPSPISSRSTTPVRGQNGVQAVDSSQVGIKSTENREDAGRGGSVTTWYSREREAPIANLVPDNNTDQAKKLNPLETRAMAWDEAERAKYMARYKREEVKIQAWENHQKRKAEMEMKRMEVKAERLKSRAQEKYTNKLASTRRIAEEKRANAESELNEKAVQTSERADYIRRTAINYVSTMARLVTFRKFQPFQASAHENSYEVSTRSDRTTAELSVSLYEVVRLLQKLSAKLEEIDEIVRSGSNWSELFPAPYMTGTVTWKLLRFS